MNTILNNGGNLTQAILLTRPQYWNWVLVKHVRQQERLLRHTVIFGLSDYSLLSLLKNNQGGVKHPTTSSLFSNWLKQALDKRYFSLCLGVRCHTSTETDGSVFLSHVLLRTAGGMCRIQFCSRRHWWL